MNLCVKFSEQIKDKLCMTSDNTRLKTAPLRWACVPAAGLLGAQNEGRGRWRCDEASAEVVGGAGLVPRERGSKGAICEDINSAELENRGPEPLTWQEVGFWEP